MSEKVEAIILEPEELEITSFDPLLQSAQQNQIQKKAKGQKGGEVILIVSFNLIIIMFVVLYDFVF